VDLFKADTGLRLNQVARFRADFGLSDVSFGALTAAGIEAVLKAHGPLWVIADEDGSPGSSVHARVVTGITGDGTPSGTQLTVNDPAVGKEVRESLAVFADKVAQLSQGAVATFGGVSPTVLAF
jgi:papain like cysteine protease AvrRpt2